MPIDYNILNQPIHRWNSSSEEWMVYDALGEKQALYHTTYTQTDTTSCKIEYVGNYVFKDGNLALIQFDGGYIDYEVYGGDSAAGYCWYMKDHLGNNRVVVDGIGTIVAVNDYDPYGSTPGEMENELTETDGSFTMDGTLWKYGGKERSDSFRDYDFDARRYSTGLLRFTTMDPLSEKYYNLSPYTYCAGNPVRYVDPTGRNPIYSPQGVFLGTDDLGLQGDYIVMDKDSFSQGMSSKAARKNQYKGVLDNETEGKILSHYSTLDRRPDWDGYLTLKEANEWYRNGNGAPLFVDINKIDLSLLYSYGRKFIGKNRTIDMFAVSGSINDALVYGHLTVKNYPSNAVKAYSDIYDFDIKTDTPIRSFPRNLATYLGNAVAGKGVGFEINIYGTKTLKPAFPWIK